MADCGHLRCEPYLHCQLLDDEDPWIDLDPSVYLNRCLESHRCSSARSTPTIESPDRLDKD